MGCDGLRKPVGKIWLGKKRVSFFLLEVCAD
jgi:hypothetical protein